MKSDQVLNGLLKYADHEVINKLNTGGKWIVGTMIAIANQNAAHFMHQLMSNPLVNALGIMDEDGNCDVDMLADALTETAQKYGDLKVEFPMVGSMSFSANDVDLLKDYIKGLR